MSDFPELQHALVDAARRRYGRAPRTWRLVRPVAVAAVCAAAAVAVFLVARPADDERSAAPGASGALERWYPVFRKPAGERDRLPLSGAALERFAAGPGGAQLDVSKTRLGVEEGSQRVYLVAARMFGAEAVCAALFRDGVETSTVCGQIDRPRRVVAAVPADSGEPPTVFGALPGEIGDLSVETSHGGFSGLAWKTNGALIQTQGQRPLWVVWGNGLGTEQSITPPRPAGQCPKLQPLPVDAVRQARRIGRAVARSAYPEALGVKIGPAVLAQRGLGAPCGAAAAARTLSVPIAVRVNRSPYITASRYGTVLVGQIDGRMQPFTSGALTRP